ncbi:GATA zinc finger domain-containing protein 14 [Hyalella azteca]|uniref:GATA zinc finger domain-containing protein 14 n=1 Tax=Hyalella azteca TaxID=294128 RepID=A0A8B7P9D0_HYAAZ|nr:GATA zinc finger domain-containing protein 14 [Hyalella azteca]
MHASTERGITGSAVLWAIFLLAAAAAHSPPPSIVNLPASSSESLIFFPHEIPSLSLLGESSGVFLESAPYKSERQMAIRDSIREDHDSAIAELRTHALDDREQLVCADGFSGDVTYHIERKSRSQPSTSANFIYTVDKEDGHSLRFRRSVVRDKIDDENIKSVSGVLTPSNSSDSQINTQSTSSSSRVSSFSLPPTKQTVRIQGMNDQVKSASAQGKSDTLEASGRHRYSPIELRHDDDDDRPDYVFRDPGRHANRNHHNQNPEGSVDIGHSHASGHHRFTIHDSFDESKDDFSSSHPQTSKGTLDHLRSPYTQSKFGEVVEHRPPPPNRDHHEHENQRINSQLEFDPFAEPRPSDIIVHPHSSDDYRDVDQGYKSPHRKERGQLSHSSQLDSSRFVTDRHPSSDQDQHKFVGEENSHHYDGSVIYRPRKPDQEERKKVSPHQESQIDGQRGQHFGDYQHDSPDYQRDEYDQINDHRSGQGDESHHDFSDGGRQHGNQHYFSHQLNRAKDQNSFDYRDEQQRSPHNSNSDPYSKKPSHSPPIIHSYSHNTAPDSADHILELSGKNTIPIIYDQSPFQPISGHTSAPGHGATYSFSSGHTRGAAHQDQLNEGGDFFHVEENIEDLPEFVDTESHENSLTKFRNDIDNPINAIGFSNHNSLRNLRSTKPNSNSIRTRGIEPASNYINDNSAKPHEGSSFSEGSNDFSGLSLYESPRFQPTHNPGLAFNFPGPHSQLPIRSSPGAAFRSNPPFNDAAFRPNNGPYFTPPSAPRGAGTAIGSSLMQFLNNLPSVNWSGRPAFRSHPRNGHNFYK